jgi:phosphoglycolate phosphatase-like HAD superfamily hydrolase
VETGGEPATFPSHDEFGWDGWAGDADGLPEPVRPWGKAIGDYHRTAAENEWKGKLNDAHQMQRVYEELMTGNEDPRIGEFSGQLAERQKAFDELQEQFNTQKTEHAQYQEQVQAWYAAEADKWTKRFERQHPKLAADPKKVELLAELFSEGWEDDMAVELLSMEEASVSTARQAIKDGVPPEYAYRLAKAQSAPAKKPQPSPAAVAMSGADSTTRHTPLSKIEPLTGNTFEDTKFAAIRRNMNKKGKRR